jgi:hypothetical protein
MRSQYALLAILPLLAACAGSPRINALHDPLYRADQHSSTITARARETRDGISSITVTATVGELTACQNGGMFALPSLIPCRQGAFSVSATCFFAAIKTEVSCALPLTMTPRRLVTYSATTRSAGNRTASTGAVTYAGGQPLTQVTIRLPFATITQNWETARPVIWRTDAPANTTDRGDRIDLGYLPNSDYGSYRAFTDDLQPMALQVFYTDTNSFSAWTRTFRNIFNLWAGPTGARNTSCNFPVDAPAQTVRGAFDATAVLHRNDFRDCATIALGGGIGTTQTTLGDGAWVFVHEMGHYVFGLGDEYVGGGNSAVSTPRNVHGSEGACQSTSTSEGLTSANCMQIGSSGTWRNDDGQLTTMEDRNLASDWRTLSGRALGNRLSACTGGQCY